MAARKRDRDIDATFKKVMEEVEVFEVNYSKLMTSTSMTQAQKEKQEEVLKRSIKKLQKYRDSIKGWHSQSDIKDKAPLLEKRKLIETCMERFKAVEKDMKTKAFSKVGLGAATKLDPKEKEREDVISFLADMVAELERQIEANEAEAESLQITVKKGKKDAGKADRLAELDRTMEQHKWHQGKLEALRRALENEGVETERVRDIQDGIKYYVDNNQEVDFMEDDSIYDDFNLVEEDDPFANLNDVDKISSQDTQSIADDTADADDKAKLGPAALLAKAKSVDNPISQVRRASVHAASKSPLPALATLHTVAANNNAAVSTGMKPAPIPSIPTGQTLKYASAAAAAATSDKSGVGLAPLPPPSNAVAANKSSDTSSPALSTAVPVAPSASPQPQATRRVSRLAGSADPSPSPVPAQPVMPKGSATSTPLLTHQIVAPPPGLSGSTPKTDGSLINGTAAASRPSDTEEPIYHLPSSLSDILESFQATKAKAGTTQPIDERMLAIAHAACPTPLDAEKPNHYRPQTPYAYTPTHYPQEPLNIFDDSRLYSKMEVDALFYSFYYRQGTYQQYLAAKALKSQSWRFHKQYQTWFQRHEEPKNITEEYEQGTYRFFDYESTWYAILSRSSSRAL